MLQGSEIQLRAIGPQDIHLYYRQDLTPFDAFSECVPRCTRYAMDTRRDPFPESFKLGSTNTFTIPRSGDLLGDIFLEVTLPVIPGASAQDHWVDAIGYVLLRKLVLKLDETVIHTQERLWYDLDDHLFMKAAHKRGVDEMIGRGKQLPMNVPHLIIVPLKFFHCKTHHVEQNFMPLIGIPGSTLSLTIETETFDNVAVIADPSRRLQPAVGGLEANMLIDYVFVEAAEKERILNRPVSILYEDVQDVEAYSYIESLDGLGGARTPVDLVKVNMREVNAPVKLIVWVVYTVTDATNKHYFQYKDAITKTEIVADTVPLARERDSGNYTLVQKYQYGINSSSQHSNVNAYSFALDASSWQPSGQLNFDQILVPELRCTLDQKRSDLVVKAFMLSYKHLIFDKGRAMLKFI